MHYKYGKHERNFLWDVLIFISFQFSIFCNVKLIKQHSTRAGLI